MSSYRKIRTVESLRIRILQSSTHHHIMLVYNVHHTIYKFQRSYMSKLDAGINYRRNPLTEVLLIASLTVH